MLSTVKMNDFAAIDSVRPFRFWADKAAIAADFHLGNGACYHGKRRIANTVSVLPIAIFAKISFSYTNENIRSKQCTAVPTRAFFKKFSPAAFLKNLVGQHPKPFNNFGEIGCAPAELTLPLEL